MSSCIVGVVNKNDLEKYDIYAGSGYQSLAGFEVEVMVAESPEVLEGNFPGTTLIVMKFKGDGDALKWFQSEAYQTAIPIRHASADTAFMIHFTTT
jgi:uncharacterized protein (DUF1330 family)